MITTFFSMRPFTVAIVAVISSMSVTTVAAAEDFNEALMPADFEARVIEVILNKPEVVLAALQMLEERKASEEKAAQSVRVDSLAQELFAANSFGTIAQGEEPILVEFADYRCGYCGLAAETMRAFSEQHEKKIRLLEFPILGPESVELARLAIGVRKVAGVDAYYAFHMALLDPDAQPKSRRLARRLIEEAGIDFNEVATSAAEPSVTAELEHNKKLAQSLGINGTPAFVSRSEVHAGMQDLQSLNRMVDAQ